MSTEKKNSRTSNRCKGSQNSRWTRKKNTFTVFFCDQNKKKKSSKVGHTDETDTPQTQKTLAINQMEMDDHHTGHNLLIFFCVLQLMSKLRRFENASDVCACMRSRVFFLFSREFSFVSRWCDTICLRSFVWVFFLIGWAQIYHFSTKASKFQLESMYRSSKAFFLFQSIVQIREKVPKILRSQNSIQFETHKSMIWIHKTIKRKVHWNDGYQKEANFVELPGMSDRPCFR